MTRRIMVAVAAVAIGMSITTAAVAAQWNSISGSSTTSWFESTNDRHVTTPNDTVQVQLGSFPSGGLSWNLIDASTGTVFTSTKTVDTTSVVTLATGVLNGTVFHNHYKSNTTSGNFSGQEWY